MGFSADWLALREPADHAARDADLLRRAAAAAGPDPVILDLGCGTGSTVRAMSKFLPDHTRWYLVDHDPDLLEHAARSAGPKARIDQRELAELDGLPLDGVTLVTASALLDLMPKAWIDELAALLSVPFYAALSYDGAMSWEPALPGDEEATAAFNLHQCGDKGLGPALGPLAASSTASTLSKQGFAIHRAKSPWQLGAGEEALQVALVEGIAQAAGEAGVTQAEEWGWRRIQSASGSACVIGHDDILALPSQWTEEESRHGAD